MSIGIVSRSFGTHDGSFHADDVTACALLLHFEMIDRDKIIRTREAGKLETCDFVCDVGGEYDPDRRRFDHHQKGLDSDLSSAGMILLYLKDEEIIAPELYTYLNRSLVHGVDEIDNGKVTPKFGHCSFSGVIANFVPVYYDSPISDYMDAFEKAVDFVLWLLARFVQKFEYLQATKAIVQDVMSEMKECLVFDRALPWLEPFFDLGGEKHAAEFVIMPAGSHWKLRGIPPSYERRMEVKRPLPYEWAGLSNEKLERISGLPGAIFCHKGRFISVWKTKEDALRALKTVLRK